MLATLGPVPPRHDEWAYEVKWDGIRALATVAAGKVRLRGRPTRSGSAPSGTDITGRYPELEELAAAAPREGTIVVDGEVVMFDESGRPSFEALQSRMHIADPAVSRRLAAERSVVYVVFDVLWTPAGDCLKRTYDERRELLMGLDLQTERVLVPLARTGDPGPFIEMCRERELEGIVSKRRDSIYRPGQRTTAWVKTKFTRSQEMVVVGWTEGTGARSSHLGALLLGYHDETGFRYGGKVGTGFRDREMRELLAELGARASDTPAVEGVPRQKTAVHWVEPTLVVEIAFAEWSSAGHLRHPSYKGRRSDIDPRSVVREPS
jgi:bifunctional non-homologous end joining protein LigD